MFKVSFKDDCKKVQTFNDRATVVTMAGFMTMPSELWAIFPDKIENWMWQHPSVDASWGKCTNHNEVIRLEFSGKAVCANDDIFDAVIGERIAESRAKIKLYKFMYKLCIKLYRHYMNMAIGIDEDKPFRPDGFCKGSLYDVKSKYQKLLIKESYHLGKLLEEA